MSNINRSPIRTIAAAMLVVAAGACSNDSDADTTTIAPTSTDSAAETTTNTPTSTASTSSTSTSTTSTTSTSSTTTTLLTVTSVSAPPTTGGPVDNEDWVATIQALLDTRHALNAAPDPTRAGEVYVPGSPNWQILENQLANKQRDGQRTVDQDPLTVLSAEMTFYGPDAGDGSEEALVTVQLQLGEHLGRIVDANGETVFELVPEGSLPADGLVDYQYGLFRFNSGPWLIGTESRL